MRIPAAVIARTRRAGAWIRGLPPAVIVAIGWAIGLIYAFPGMMSMDSIDQLREGRAGFYTDGHPPAMAAMWGIVDAIVPGPFGMLLIQSGAFIAGVYLLLRRALAPRRAAVATVLVFLFPPVLAPLAVIWKDCIMAAGFVLGTALIVDERRTIKVLGLFCMFAATAVRYNAPAATLPLVVLLLDWPLASAASKLRRLVARYAIAVAAWAALTAAAFGLNAWLVDAPMFIWQSTLAPLDIAGTLAHVDGTIPDEELRELFAGSHMLVDHDIHDAFRKKYVECTRSGMDFEPLTAMDGPKSPGHFWDLPLAGTTPAPPEVVDAITRAFWRVVREHPGAYLAHRLQAFEDVLGITHTLGGMVFTHRTQYPKIMDRLHLQTGWTRHYDEDPRPAPVQDFMQRKVVWIAKHTPVFHPWLYCIVALVLLPLAIRPRDRDVLALLLSGLGLEASLFIFAPSPDYRYSHWLVVAVLLSVVMLTARRARAPSGKPAPNVTTQT